jgi:crossover junction endodeoxyribonuclease RuvC
MGYSVITVCGPEIQVRESDVLILPRKLDMYERLSLIHAKVLELVKHYHPSEFAIEAPFFGKNVQSMLKLGRAQGVAIAAAFAGGLTVTEYSPKKVKQSITGNGNADKEQVWKMVQHITQMKEKPKYFDASDALAVALCHHFQTSGVAAVTAPKKAAAKKKAGGWEQFVSENKHRVR